MSRNPLLSEAEWLGCTDPTPMLRFMRGRMTDRKHRLFACYCCRRLGTLITDPRCEKAIEVAELFADRKATRRELARARRTLDLAEDDAKGAVYCAETAADFLDTAEYCAVGAARSAVCAVRIALSVRAGVPDESPVVYICDDPEPPQPRSSRQQGSDFFARNAVAMVARSAVYRKFGVHNSRDPDHPCSASSEMAERFWQAREPAEAAYLAAREHEGAKQADLLRELVGNPFHPVRIETSWLCWINGPIRRVLKDMYRTGLFEELPILADAIEESGCQEGALLSHLRSAQPHARGCWAVDLLMRRG